MSIRKRLGISTATLLLLSILVRPPHVAGYSSSELPAIRIGERSTSNYGVLTPWGGLAFDPSGNLWVADTENNRSLEFKPPFYDKMNAAIVIGQPTFQRTKGGTAANELKYPMYVTFDRSANLWVSDSENNRLLEFKPPFFNGMNASIVLGQQNFTTAFDTTTQSGLSYPGQVAFDSSGNLWVPDGGNSRILEYQPPFTTGMNASLVLGEPDFTHRYCDPHSWGVQTHCSNRSSLNDPSEVTFDQQGNLWVAETNWGSTFGIAVFKPPFTAGMRPSFRFESVLAQNLAFDSGGNLWIACWFCGHVAEFKPPFSENSITWYGGAGPTPNATTTLGGGDCCSSPDLIPNVMTPTGLAFDSAGNLWVVDSRSTWLMPGLFGRVVGYDAQVHPLDTTEGRGYFKNHAGLLTPLISIPFTQMNSIRFPVGLFNFTIQGLQPGGSVTVTITFASPLAPGTEWLSKSNGNWSVLASNQTSIQDNNLTVTLGKASRTGVISVFGGPAYPPPNLTSASETASTSIIVTTPLSSQSENIPLLRIVGILGIAVVVIAAVAVRKRGPRTPKKAIAVA